NPLPDSIGSAAENSDLVPAVGVRLAARFVRAVEIGRERFELGRARIHTLVDRLDLLLQPAIADRVFFLPCGQADFGIAETRALQAAHTDGIDAVETGFGDRVLHVADFGK